MSLFGRVFREVVRPFRPAVNMIAGGSPQAIHHAANEANQLLQQAAPAVGAIHHAANEANQLLQQAAPAVGAIHHAADEANQLLQQAAPAVGAIHHAADKANQLIQRATPAIGRVNTLLAAIDPNQIRSIQTDTAAFAESFVRCGDFLDAYLEEHQIAINRAPDEIVDLLSALNELAAELELEPLQRELRNTLTDIRKSSRSLVSLAEKGGNFLDSFNWKLLIFEFGVAVSAFCVYYTDEKSLSRNERIATAAIGLIAAAMLTVSVISMNEKRLRKVARISQIWMGRRYAKYRLDNSSLLEQIGRANDDDLKAIEKILVDDPNLIFAQGKLVEPNGREFRCISAWQHALWSGDPDLLNMLLAHVSSDADGLAYAREQYDQLVERPQELSDHGSNYDVQPLIDAEQSYVDNCGDWSDQQRRDQWCKVIGGLQCQLPAWVMYAWYEKGNHAAWVTKSLGYTPEQELAITRDREAMNWFLESEYNGGQCGDEWASGRGSNLQGMLVAATQPSIRNSSLRLPHLTHDIDVLKKCRQPPGAKECLKSRLHAEDCNPRAGLRQ